MKKLLSFISFIFIFATTYSQNINFQLKKGEPIRLKISTYVQNSVELGVIGNYAYFLLEPYQEIYKNEISLNSKEYYIYKFDLNNNLIKTTALKLVQDKKELEFEGAIKLQENILIFSSFQNIKDKKHYLFVQNFDPKTGELSNNHKLLAELDYSGYSKFKNTTFKIEVSPDSSKVLIFYTLVNDSNEILRSGINVYDNEINLQWKNDKVTTQFSQGYFEFNKFRINNDGEVFIFGQQYVEILNCWVKAQFRSRDFLTKDSYFVGESSYTYRIYHYSNKTDKVQGYTFELPEKFIRDMSIQASENGNVLCSGVYSKPGKVSVVGTFNFEYNTTTNSIEKISTFEFSKELLSKDLSEEELKRYKSSIANKQEWDPFSYKISDIKTKQNGDKYFVAEQYLNGRKVTTTGKMTIDQAIYWYNDLFVVSLDKQNQINKVDKISKRQYYLDQSKFSSYKLIENNNNLYFFFSTFVKAAKKSYYEINILESSIVKLDEKGIQSRAIFKTNDEYKQPLPCLVNSMQISTNSIQFFTFPISMKGARDLIYQQIIIKE
jgi:hypothetical protein